MIANSLATAVGMVKILIHSNQKYSIHVKHCLAVPNNMTFWKKNWDDKQIDNFLQLEGEFHNSHIDDTCNMNDVVIQSVEIEIL